MTHTVHFYRSIEDSLNAVSPGLCLAKWYEVTIHLQNGHTHSCHNPATHLVPLSELAVNPSALHNTQHKQLVRTQMLAGQKPQECSYCWNIEHTVNDPDRGIFTDRVIKSGYDDMPTVAETVAAGTVDPLPRYLEVSFSSTCNFKCSYCSAEVSSAWMKELTKHGPYPIESAMNTIKSIEHNRKMPISDRDYNPYIQAFWSWWPTVYPTLNTMRITGGEPLLSPHTGRVLAWIQANPKPNLRLGVNTNMSVSPKLIDRFIKSIKSLTDSGAVKEFTLYTSCEAQGSNAEYIRFGLRYDQWLVNCEQFLTQVPMATISIMATYNAMSAVSYFAFLVDMKKLKTKFPNRIMIDTSFLSFPKFLSIDILTEDFLVYIQQQVVYLDSMTRQGHCTEDELHQIKRLESYFRSRLAAPLAELSMLRRDFKQFVDEHDRRRGTDFLTAFPKMQQFYDLCAGS